MKYKIIPFKNATGCDIIVENGQVATIYKTESGYHTICYTDKIPLDGSNTCDYFFQSGSSVHHWGTHDISMEVLTIDALHHLFKGYAEWVRDDSILPHVNTIWGAF